MSKRSSHASPTGEMFYHDLISEILVRLPVNILLRLKSVSKSWYALISSPNFIKSHLQLATEARQTLIIREDRGWAILIALLDLDFGAVVADLNFPYSKCEVPSLRASYVVGSARGIVCVCVSMPDDDSYSYRPYFPDDGFDYDSYAHHLSFADGGLFIYLWNPATKHSKLIPPSTNVDDRMRVSVGFGYDPIGDDFKVVRISSAFAEVYSSNRNAWRKVDANRIQVPSDNIFNCCVNGYVCSTTGWSDMIAFDLNKEVLKCGIKFPGTYFGHARITDYGDHIAVITWRELNPMRVEKEGNDIIRLWTLDDEACLRGGGVEASWTLKLSVEIDFLPSFVYGYFRGDLLLVSRGDWVLYNCEMKETSYIQAPYVRDEIFKYTKSLVSIQGSKKVSWDGNWLQHQVEDEGEDKFGYGYEFDYDYEEDEAEDEGEFEYVYEGEHEVAVEDEDEDED